MYTVHAIIRYCTYRSDGNNRNKAKEQVGVYHLSSQNKTSTMFDKWVVMSPWALIKDGVDLGSSILNLPTNMLGCYVYSVNIFPALFGQSFSCLTLFLWSLFSFLSHLMFSPCTGLIFSTPFFIFGFQFCLCPESILFVHGKEISWWNSQPFCYEHSSALWCALCDAAGSSPCT